MCLEGKVVILYADRWIAYSGGDCLCRQVDIFRTRF